MNKNIDDTMNNKYILVKSFNKNNINVVFGKEYGYNICNICTIVPNNLVKLNNISKNKIEKYLLNEDFIKCNEIVFESDEQMEKAIKFMEKREKRDKYIKLEDERALELKNKYCNIEDYYLDYTHNNEKNNELNKEKFYKSLYSKFPKKKLNDLILYLCCEEKKEEIIINYNEL